MDKKYLVLIFFLQSWILFGFLMTTPIQSVDSIQETSDVSAKPSAAWKYVRILDEFIINDETVLDQQYPAICNLTGDTFAVAWESQDQDGSGDGIYTSVFSASTGKNLTNEVKANYNATNSQWNPSICTLSSDTYAVAWDSNEQDGDNRGIYARIFNATTGKNITKEFRANYETSGMQFQSSMCLLSNGNLLIAWTSNQVGSQHDIYARVFNTTTWNNVTAEKRLNVNNAENQWYPSVCALSNNKFAAAWQSYDQDAPNTYGTYARVFNGTDGESLSGEFRLNHKTTNNQYNPSICTLSSDIFAAVWHSMGQDGSGNGVYTRIFNATTNTNITSETRVNQETYSHQEWASICALSEDYYVMAWQSYEQDGDSIGIYGRIFNAKTGTAVTPEFGINQIVLNQQNQPSICALSSTSFAVVWNSNKSIDLYDVHCTTYRLTAAGKALIGIAAADDDDDDDEAEISGYDVSILIGGIAVISVALILIKWKLKHSFKK